MSNLYTDLSAVALELDALPLTCKGLGFVNWDCNDYELEFVFGADKVCRVPSLLAEFLSPKIAYLRRCDVTFEVYTFKDCEMFNLFESLLSSLRSGAAFHVEKSNFSFRNQRFILEKCHDCAYITKGTEACPGIF